MPLNVTDILNQMLGAALPKLTAGGQSAIDTAKDEFAQIAAEIASITEDVLQGNLTETEAQNLLKMQVERTDSALMEVQGLVKLSVEEAINAALSVVKTAVNTAAGLAIIP